MKIPEITKENILDTFDEKVKVFDDLRYDLNNKLRDLCLLAFIEYLKNNVAKNTIIQIGMERGSIPFFYVAGSVFQKEKLEKSSEYLNNLSFEEIEGVKEHFQDVKIKNNQKGYFDFMQEYLGYNPTSWFNIYETELSKRKIDNLLDEKKDKRKIKL